MRSYYCAMCGGYQVRSDEDSLEDVTKEAEGNGFCVDDCELVCDECYGLTPWRVEV